MKRLSYIAFIASVLLLNACTQDDIASYEQDARIYFRIPGEFNTKESRDSLVYSFPFHPTAVEKDTIWFEANIMGNAAPKDREFKIEVDTANTTAKVNVDYKIVDSIIPAGVFKKNIPVVIYKTAELIASGKPLRLQLNAVENQNFKVGYDRFNKAVLVWGSKFIKPANWDGQNYEKAFGSFSQKKVQLILDVCKITQLPNPDNIDMIGYYNLLLRAYVADYNRGKTFANQLKDENNVNIFIPTYGAPGLG
ncbi:DUF4843 domain-containing protein [Solitalea sp. MAHUQ-68]|uniref:DUF4843 domain-containing protein n=1 Tax=Solitalea agri TaxID=2953739 RepID=A0A9X2JDZ2_9SPHI|nr:DUF4843 domain-containing protein [Solitalea agri]MCO4291881.1 DUF4843 domain-containing protein [Solitalea agri]